LAGTAHAVLQGSENCGFTNGGSWGMKMRRFVPGVDSYLGAEVPASLMRFSEPAPQRASAGVGPSSDGDGPGRFRGIETTALINEQPTTLIEKYRNLCYWRQVVNAENN
jgi:hypothetical protein